MSKYLKGTYDVKTEIIEKDNDGKSLEDDFREKAINSIGGSMVFVERNRMTWDGGEDDENNDETAGKA